MAYLDDALVFDSDPTVQAKTLRTLFERLWTKLSPSKAHPGATDADFLSHSISPAGVRSDAEKVSALIRMPMPRDLKQARAWLGGVGYYRKFLRGLSKHICPITSLLRKGVEFDFTAAIH